MWQLIAILVTRAMSRVAASPLAKMIGVTGGAAIGTDITLDWLRQQALDVAPGSDPEAIEEAARTTMRLLGLEGDEVMWPRHRDGTAISPQYFILDLTKGRAWFSQRYYSRKSVQAGRRRGNSRGFRAGQRNIATISQAQRG